MGSNLIPHLNAWVTLSKLLSLSVSLILHL